MVNTQGSLTKQVIETLATKTISSEINGLCFLSLVSLIAPALLGQSWKTRAIQFCFRKHQNRTLEPFGPNLTISNHFRQKKRVFAPLPTLPDHCGMLTSLPSLPILVQKRAMFWTLSYRLFEAIEMALNHLPLYKLVTGVF